MSYISELRALVGHRPLILVGVHVMVFDEKQRILLQHRTEDNTWDLPGGFMELGETTEETARRELLEETGLEAGNLTLFQIFSGEEYFYIVPNGDQVYSVSPVYVTNDVKGDLKVNSDEAYDFQYFPTGELPGGMLPSVRKIVESYCKLTGL
jgi:8-oxo-dGTP pyrophosphatase MutT (NUDIX family)